MKTKRIKDDEIPYFAWDRALNAGAIRKQLCNSSKKEWVKTATWIMREAVISDVWQFLTPDEVYARFSELQPFLGRRKKFWSYILETWHELGRI